MTWFADLDAASLEDLSLFFSTYYTPDNAVLSVAGDFDRAEARAMIERHFGGIPRGAGKPPLPDMSLPDTFGGSRREVVADDVMLPRLFMAFRSPAFGTDEFYDASVAGAILGLKKGSRLHRALVREQQVAAEATAFTYDLAKGSDLLVVDVTARPEATLEQLEQAVAAEIDKMIAGGVTQDEVERAVTLIETSMVEALQSAGERADKLSMFATYFGDPAVVNEQSARYQAVTSERVNAFARERLIEANRASLIFVPRDGEDAVASSDLAMAEAP